LKDREILDAIQKGPPEEHQALRALYQQFFPSVLRFVATNQGSKEDAHDVFQDSVLIFYNAVRKGTFREQSSIGTFLHSIARNQWRMELRARNRNKAPSLEPVEETKVETPILLLLKKERQHMVAEVVSKLEKPCQEMLRLSVYLGKSMKEISKHFGYSSEQVARNQKHRCLKYLSRLILSSPLFSTLRSFADEEHE